MHHTYLPMGNSSCSPNQSFPQCISNQPKLYCTMYSALGSSSHLQSEVRSTQYYCCVFNSLCVCCENCTKLELRDKSTSLVFFCAARNHMPAVCSRLGSLLNDLTKLILGMVPKWRRQGFTTSSRSCMQTSPDKICIVNATWHCFPKSF